MGRQAILTPREGTRDYERGMLRAILRGQKANASSADRERALNARKELLEYLHPLLMNVASRYVKYHEPIGDLITAGNKGIRKAILRYDLKKRYKFSTYATWWIREEIHKLLGIQ